MNNKGRIDGGSIAMLIFVIVAVLLLVGAAVTALRPQSIARNLGGDIVIELEPGLKLEEITWKDSSLWYLTRPMRDDEKAETHVFQESSDFGIMEGTVTVIETNLEDAGWE